MNVYQNVNVTGDATVSGKVTAQTLEANALGANAQAVVNSMIRAVFPVGTYLSGPSDPGSYIGGTWEQIKGKFLLASDDVLENGVITTAGTYHVGDTGGEAMHTLTVSEMPQHSHVQRTQPSALGWQQPAIVFADGETASGIEQIGNSAYQTNASNKQLLRTQNDGEGQSHNNMPPYVVGYLWKRIA